MTTSAARASKAWLQRNKELQEAIITLYTSSSPPAALDAAFTHCHPRIQFTDPIVDVRGIDNYQAQFRALRWLFSSYKPQTLEFTADFDRIMIDATIEWNLSFLRFPLRQVTVLHVSEGGLGLITKHEDLWSYADLFMALPLIGLIYGWLRQFQGHWISQYILSRSKNESWVREAQQSAKTATPIRSSSTKSASNNDPHSQTSVQSGVSAASAGVGPPSQIQMEPLPEYQQLR